MLARNLLVILFLAVIGSTISQDSSTDNFSIFGELLSEDTLNFKNFDDLSVVKPYLVIRTESDYFDSSEFRIIDPINLNTVWSMTGPWNSIRISSGEPKCIVLQYGWQENIESTLVVDFNSNTLFALDLANYIVVPASNSNYFYSQYDELLSNELVVYDRNGKILFKNPNGIKLGYSFAMNDSILIIVGYSAITAVQVPSGNILKFLPPIKARQEIAKSITFENGKGIILNFKTWEDDLDEFTLYIDNSLNIRWIDSSFMGVNSFVLSDDNSFLALTCSSVEGAYLALIEAETGRLIWQESLETDFFKFIKYGGLLEFSGSFIRVAPYNYNWWDNKDSSFETAVLKIDNISGEIVDKTKLPGFTSIVSRGGRFKTFTSQSNNRYQIVVREWETAN